VINYIQWIFAEYNILRY